jgi:hypothetical protein
LIFSWSVLSLADFMFWLSIFFNLGLFQSCLFGLLLPRLCIYSPTQLSFKYSSLTSQRDRRLKLWSCEYLLVARNNSCCVRRQWQMTELGKGWVYFIGLPPSFRYLHFY